MTPSERFLAACRHQPTDVPPVWLMRQAGRYMPEYRAIRARHSLIEICRTPALAAEVTVTAAERLQTDAAIIFADLLLPAEPLGLKLEFTVGEGPALTPRIATAADVARLPHDWGGALGYVSESIRLVNRHFGGRVPVIGFAGAPFTLASYLIEGGSSRHYAQTKRLMHGQPRVWDELMTKLADGLSGYLAEQAGAGAAALQLFDSWAGALSEADYRRFVLPYNRLLISRTRGLGVPTIYFSTGTSAYLETLNEIGADVLSLDWRLDLGTAWKRLRTHTGTVRPGSTARRRAGARQLPVLQGNLDPVLLLADREVLRAAVRGLLEQARGHNGYIFNLGHGLLPETPVERVRELVAWVHDDER